MDISVIIPVYNTSQRLKSMLECVMNQTMHDIEIILVDDGSTDASGKICDDYACWDSRFKVIHQSNQGVSVARNTGLNIAQGKYICFLDSDDDIDLCMLEKLHNAAIQADADIVTCDLCCNNEIFDATLSNESI